VLLPRLVASELTTLSVCELDTGHRSVVSDAPGGIGAAQVQAFDRHFHEHPLVRAHGQRGDRVTRTIDELVDARSFRRSPLYADYYRVIGIDHVLALPLHVDRTRLVSFVLNRRGRRFSVEECALLECMRPTLAALYRAHAGTALPASVAAAACAPLTDREREVMRWVSAGKTNRDIAEILGARVRTVEKHLERVYAKLGVETRTAAAMRWRAGS
jgi:DNA-binding CsgD family transcriptional regulator